MEVQKKKRKIDKRKFNQSPTPCNERDRLLSLEDEFDIPDILFASEAKEKALAFARGVYQRGIIYGTESPTHHIFKGKAAKWSGSYHVSRLNLYTRLRQNKIPVFPVGNREAYVFLFGESALIEILRFRSQFNKNKPYISFHSSICNFKDPKILNSDEIIKDFIDLSLTNLEAVRGFYNV